MGLMLYKYKKEFVCKALYQDNQIIQEFIKTIELNDQHFYSVEDIEEHYSNDEKTIKVIDKFMVDNKLYGFDLVVE